MRVREISACVLGILMVSSAVLLPQFLSAGGERTTVYIYRTGDEVLLSSLSEVSVVAEYPDYIVAEVSRGDMVAMDRMGLTYSREATMVHLARATFDPLTDEPRTSGPLSLPARDDLRLVQFVGPVEDEWKESIQMLGVKIHAYVPENTFIVTAPKGVLGDMATMPFIRWMGSYRPYYRVSPALDPATGSVSVNILVTDWENARTVAYDIHKAGGSLRYMSERSPSVITASVDASSIPEVASSPGVLWVEPALQVTTLNANASKTMQNYAGFNNSIWDRGIHGEQQILGITDTGLTKNHTAFSAIPSKLACYIVWPGATDNDDKDSNYHGSHTSGTLAGYDPQNPYNKGMAYQGQICIIDIGRQESTGGSVLVVPADLRDLYRPLVQNGAMIISNSWGSRYSAADAGAYTTFSYTADRFMWENPESLVVFAQGNDGHASDMMVMAPATAKSVVSVGGTDNGNGTGAQENAYIGSSAGPTRDGRVKPTVTAPANPVYSVDGSTTSGYIPYAGTSMASPVVAGSLGLVRQYIQAGWYPLGEPRPANGYNASGALMKAVAVNSADDMTGTDVGAPIPNTVEGWGRMDLENTLFFKGESKTLRIVDFKAGISTGEFMDYKYNITSGSPLKVTLAWTDYPGTPSASKQIVNDLDLIVTAPNGTVYYGNNLVNGESQSGGTPDSTNVVETVLLKTPASGIYTVRIFARDAPMGPQPYAFVMSAEHNMDQGTVKLDKAAYGENQMVNILLEDNSFSGSSTQNVPVLVSSDTEQSPETVTLSGRFGVLTGSIQTTLVQPASDGMISVSHGDTITVEYTDASPPGTSVATAKVDLRSPAITNVHVEFISDSGGVVMWNTSKSSTSTVYYGKTPQEVTSRLNKVVISQLSVLHQVALTGLDPQTLYYFDVESTDRNGHTVLADAGGMHYSFTTLAVTDVLLIDGGGVTEDTTWGYTAIYRDDLQKHGWTVNVVVPEVSGLPALPILQRYKVVMWETGINKYPPLTKIQADLLTQYNDGGGRLLVSGHDIGWALVDPGSGYTQPWGDNWIKSELKGAWLSDPVQNAWSQLNGIAGDPISGDYTGGIPYKTARSGADGDEISAWSAGGTSVILWKNDQNLEVAARWNSSANNGTSGQGYWGGTPSKVVWYAFELFRISDDVARAQVFNKTLIWLIGHGAPIVDITSPVGGPVSGQVQVSWTVKTFGGTSVKNQTIYLSRNDGQSWMTLANVPAGTTTYTWDTTLHNNGDRYRLKVVAQDDGTPSLTGFDTTDRLVITNPNGDREGPLVVPGSVYIDPNPAKSATPIFINASADDTTRGGSNVTAAEVFVDTPGANGTGSAMNASDLAWDSPVEDVFFFGNMSATPGAHTLYVHAMDEQGNWGPFANLSIVVNPGTPNYSSPPRVLYHAPTGDNVSLNTQVTALFSKPMNWTTTLPAFSVRVAGGAYVQGGTSSSGNTLVFTPASQLSYGTLYEARVNATATDENGLNLTADFIWQFRTLPYFGWIAGTVSEVNGGPLANATVKLLNATGTVNQSQTLSDGSYVVGAVPGTYSVNASLATYLPDQKDNIIVRPGKFTTGVDLNLLRGIGIITGKVTCSGKPVPGARLNLYDPGGSLVKSASTSPNGRYTFSDIVMGVYSLNATKSGVGSKNISGVTVKPQQTTTVDIDLCGGAAPGSITGTVTDAVSGSPLANAAVDAKYKSNGTAAGSTSTAPDGTYTLASLPADTYTVTATLSGYLPTSSDATVTPGATTYLNLTLTPTGAAGSISGSVRDGDGNALQGATVTAESGATTVSNTTDASGNYVLFVPTGATYTVSASLTGYRSASKQNIAVNSTGVDFVLTAIRVVSSTPTEGKSDVALDAEIVLTFSVPMDTNSVVNALSLTPSVGGLAYSWSSDNTTLTITHSENFKESTTYTLSVPASVKDSSGGSMLSGFTLSFTTVAAGPPPAGTDILVPLLALVAVIVIALALFAVLRMRRKPPEEEEEGKKPPEEEEQKEEGTEEPLPEGSAGAPPAEGGPPVPSPAPTEAAESAPAPPEQKPVTEQK